MQLSNLRHKLYFLALITLLGACRNENEIQPSSSEDGELVNVSFTMLLPSATRAEVPLPAEQIRTLRVVMVDLGYSQNGEWVAPPSVEYNELLIGDLIQREDAGYPSHSDVEYTDKQGIVKISIPRIHADRHKKLYVLVNAEPELQPSLNIRLADGSVVEGYGNLNLFLPEDETSLPAVAPSPIDQAVFVAPRGSYVQSQNLNPDEELLVPLTGCFSFSMPGFAQIEEDYPTLNPKLTYPLPGELLLVRAVNKIWFNFINNTYQAEDHFKPLELLITEWSLSGVNHGDSYLFGHPDKTNSLFDGYIKTENNINEPWMQWIYDEALRSQQDQPYQWLEDYNMPDGANGKKLVFLPGNYNPKDNELPKDNEGIYIPAPKNLEGFYLSTELQPVYFAESHAGSPQQYELAFTVWQREEGKEWSNPFVYHVTSSIDINDEDSFHLLSLFRNTDVEMEIRFITGRSGVEMVAELHPYGSVNLSPSFGL